MTTHLAASTVGWNWGRPEEDAMTAAAIDSDGGGRRVVGTRATEGQEDAKEAIRDRHIEL